MEEYLKNLKAVLVQIENLKSNDPKEFEKIKFKMIDLLEIQILKKELIENIQVCDNFKFLNILNNMLKIGIEKNYK